MSDPCESSFSPQHTNANAGTKAGDQSQSGGDNFRVLSSGIRVRIARNRAGRGCELSEAQPPRQTDVGVAMECEISLSHRGLTDAMMPDLVTRLQREVTDTLLGAGYQTTELSSRISRMVACVDLSDNSLGNTAVEALLKWFTELGRCVHIRILKLYKNKISDHGAKAIARFIEHCQKSALEELHLSHNKITADGALSLLQAFAAASSSHSGSRVHSSNFVYPRFEPSRRLRLPVWVRLEFNHIADHLRLLRNWTATAMVQRSNLVSILSDADAPGQRNARNIEADCAGLVCFAERLLGQTAIKNSECSPARCGCASSEGSPIIHLFAFRRQSLNNMAGASEVPRPLAVTGPSNTHPSVQIPPVTQQQPQAPPQPRDKPSGRRERNNFPRNIQPLPIAHQRAPKHGPTRKPQQERPLAATVESRQRPLASSSPIVATLQCLDSPIQPVVPMARPPLPSQSNQALPLYVFVDGAALLAMSQIRDWRDPSKPNLFSLPAIYSLCSAGMFGGQIYGSNGQDESQKVIVVVVDVALRQAREIACSNPVLLSELEHCQDTLLTALRVDYGVIEVLDVSDVVKGTDLDRSSLATANNGNSLMLEFLEFAALWSHHVRKIECRRVSNQEVTERNFVMDVSTVAVVTAGAENIEFCKRWQEHRKFISTRNPNQVIDFGNVECFELSEVNRELDAAVGDVLRSVLANNTQVSTPEDAPHFVMNALFLRHIFQAIAHRDVAPPQNLSSPLLLGRGVPTAISTAPPRYRTEPADFQSPSVVPNYPMQELSRQDLIRQLREELLSGISLLRELSPYLSSSVNENPSEYEHCRQEVFRHIDRWSRLVLATDSSSNFHQRFASARNVVGDYSSVMDRPPESVPPPLPPIDFFPISPSRASWHPDMSPRRQTQNDMPSWLWR